MMLYKIKLLVQEITPYEFEIEAETEQEAITYVREKAFLDEGKQVEPPYINDLGCWSCGVINE